MAMRRVLWLSLVAGSLLLLAVILNTRTVYLPVDRHTSKNQSCVGSCAATEALDVKEKFCKRGSDEIIDRNRHGTSDPPNDRTAPHNTTTICRCTDPTIPLEWMRPEWPPHHERLVQQARNNVDVVLVGDSLVELWNGTQRWGQRAVPRMKRTADPLLGRANLTFTALGTTGDTAPNLLWHLEHGIVLNTDDDTERQSSTMLHPRLWIILIGTNDLARTHCSPQATVDGISNVAQTIHRHRPNASILVHGLLPRGQGRKNGGMYTLGRLWDDIQWVNAHLEETFNHNNMAPSWYYYRDTGDMFLLNNNNDLAAGRTLNTQLLPDGIHPSVQGLQVWGEWLVTQMHDILQISSI